MKAKAILVLFLLWCLVFAGHMLREIWILVYRPGLLAPCRRWWCPEGIRNRWKK